MLRRVSSQALRALPRSSGSMHVRFADTAQADLRSIESEGLEAAVVVEGANFRIGS